MTSSWSRCSWTGPAADWRGWLQQLTKRVLESALEGETSRRFDPNIQRKRYWVPSEGRYVRLTLSAKAIKTVDGIGIEAAVARIRARGGKV